MNSQKRIVSIVLGIILSFAMSVVCLAQPATADTPESQKAFVTFVYGGTSSGEWVIKGTSVTPPPVPVIAGATFCGWDAPLTNIQANQQINAVYKSNTLGEAAIEAAKKALPTPATSATGVADPNAAPIVPLTPIATTATPATTAVPATTATKSTPAAATQPTAEQQQQFLALLMAQQQAQQQVAVNNAALPNNTANAPVVTKSSSGSGMVWLSATGEKYHSIPNCGNMNPDKATQVTLEEALRRNKGRCKDCW